MLQYEDPTWSKSTRQGDTADQLACEVSLSRRFDVRWVGEDQIERSWRSQTVEIAEDIERMHLASEMGLLQISPQDVGRRGIAFDKDCRLGAAAERLDPQGAGAC